MKHIFKGDTFISGEFNTTDPVIHLNSNRITADLGMVISKPIADITDANSYGFISAATVNSVSLTDTVAANWMIEITSGAATGDKKIIKKATGVAPTVLQVEPWLIVPSPGDSYALYKNTEIGFIYKAGQFILGHTADLGNIVDITPAPLLVSAITESYVESVCYVGKHGADSNTGAHHNVAKLTFTAALLLNKPIICQDAELYAETITISAPTTIWAPSAKITGVICNASSQITFGEITTVTANADLKITAHKTSTVTVTAGTTDANINDAGSVSCAGTLNLRSTKINSISGTGVIKYTSVARVHDHIENVSNPHSVTLTQITPQITRGDLIGFDTAPNRVPIGLDGEVLVADSTTSLGLKWANTSAVRSGNFYLTDNVISNWNIYYTLCAFTWVQSEYGGFLDGKIIFYVDSVSGVDLRFSDGITTYMSGNYTTGYYAESIITPAANAVISLEIRGYGTLSGAVLRFGSTSESVTNSITEFASDPLEIPYQRNVSATMDHIFVDTTGGPVTLTLPTAFNKKYIIVDKGNATNADITVNCILSGVFGKTVINVNFGSITFISNGTAWYGI